jgi:hypothetical protein
MENRPYLICSADRAVSKSPCGRDTVDQAAAIREPARGRGAFNRGGNVDEVDFRWRLRVVAGRRRRHAIAGASPTTAAASRATAALRAPLYRDQAAAPALPPLCRLARAAAPAERHGALSAVSLLVGEGVTVIPALTLGRGRERHHKPKALLINRMRNYFIELYTF